MLDSTSSGSPCPVSKVLEIISAKWTVEILRELALQATRTRRFLLHIPGLSMKTLCRRLHVLEDSGLISRHEFPGKILKVEYRLTENGVRLCQILEQMKVLEEGLNTACVSCKCSLEKECFGQPEEMECPYRRVRKSK